MTFRADVDACGYLPYMENIGTDILERVLAAEKGFDPDAYTVADVRRAIAKDRLDMYDFGALLSPAAVPLLEEIAEKARKVTRDHFGNSVCMFSFAFSTLTADSATFTSSGSCGRLSVSTPVVSPSTFSSTTGCENSITKKSFCRRAQPTEWR